MRIIYSEDYGEMSRKAAALLAARMREKPDGVFGFATGSSPVGTYRELIRMYKAGELSFSRCKSVNLDEYLGLGPESDQSYLYFMMENLFSKVDMQPENIHIPDGLAEDAAAECARYDGLLESLGGAEAQVLGIGRNGHVAFNEPGDVFLPETHVVALTEDTIKANARFFASDADVPRYALTMGVKGILSAKTLLLVANGKEKARALYDACFGPVDPRVPASVLRLHKDAVIIAERDALSLILERHPEAVEK
ncbi:MAG TPA: glucosamine-6-phosphate deaminase [Oscillospiraceae bacterium]|nr:glucosamine-6-phosphate deaminase [Oscillospiraceae bacterium]HNW03825.1 glucosamine-6-phosphate deaminase [Oscillospiraceae bacterium]HPW00336.1 glucosamine-6-phosphate deaminase [Oscillospiraceae bacterium]